MYTITDTISVTMLRQLIIDANYKQVEVFMSCNGDSVTIIPCTQAMKATRMEDIEYFLVESPSLPYISDSSLEKVVHNLNSYQKLLDEQDEDKVRLSEIKTRLVSGHYNTQDEWEADYQFYSDFHKDTYGYRPRDIRRRYIA